MKVILKNYSLRKRNKNFIKKNSKKLEKKKKFLWSKKDLKYLINYKNKKLNDYNGRSRLIKKLNKELHKKV